MRYLSPVNADIPFKDWRDPAYRKEAFILWLNWRYLYRDLDHYNWNRHYMAGSQPDDKPMTREQKLWFCFFFGMTYQSSMAWVFYWHFPDPSKIDFEEMDRWNRETMPHQKFATDTRYNKGHLVSIVKSFLSWVEKNGGTLEKAFDKFVDSDPVASFHRVYNELKELHKFGRMTAWIFCQNLWECAGLQIIPDTMFASDSSSVSVWNGMMFLENREDMTVGDVPKFAGYKPTAADRAWVDGLEKDLADWVLENLEHKDDFSMYSLESHLCQFKKIFTGGDYPGHSAGDATSRMKHLQRGFPNVNFYAFGQAVESLPEHLRWKRNSKQIFKLFQKTGQFINLQNHYKQMPDMLSELDFSAELIDIEIPIVDVAEKLIGERIDAYAARQGLSTKVTNESSIEGFFL